jgi:hypothetical protein
MASALREILLSVDLNQYRRHAKIRSDGAAPEG